MPMSGPMRSRSPWPARLGLLLAGALVGALLVTALWAVLSLNRTSVVARVAQPASVRYDQATYQLLLRRSRSVGSPVIGGTQYRFWVTRAGSSDYGHSVGLDVDGVDHLDRASFTVTWQSDAVRIRLRSGHELVVPASSFTGGR